MDATSNAGASCGCADVVVIPTRTSAKTGVFITFRLATIESLSLRGKVAHSLVQRCGRYSALVRVHPPMAATSGICGRLLMNRSATRRARSSRSRSPSSGSALPLTESISDAEGRGPEVRPESTRNAALRSIRSMGRVSVSTRFWDLYNGNYGGYRANSWYPDVRSGWGPSRYARPILTVNGWCLYHRTHTPAGWVRRSVATCRIPYCRPIAPAPEWHSAAVGRRSEAPELAKLPAPVARTWQFSGATLLNYSVKLMSQ